MEQPLTPYIEVGTYVEVVGMDIRGRVTNIQLDERDAAIVIVELDDATATPTGLYIARPFELRAL